MKKYVVLIGLMLVFSPAFAIDSQYANVDYVVKDGYSDFVHTDAVDTIDFGFLDNIELRILGKSFSGELTNSRLSRIESQIFGAIQSGSFPKRLDLIRQYSNRYLISNNIGGAYGANPNGMFGYRPRHYRNGALTGFSPPVNYNQYFAYNPQINNDGLFTKIRRAFNPSYNYNQFGHDPYLNRNYNHNCFFPFFDGQTNGLNGGNYYRGYGFDTNESANSGASVTIID